MDEIQANGNSLSQQSKERPVSMNNKTEEAFAELERGVHAALETYSNVHRGSGHNSMVSTHLYEQSRDIVLEYLGLKKSKYVVIFCTPRRAKAFKVLLKEGNYKIVSSKDIGLSLGVRALAVRRKAFPGGAPFETGGGTTRLVSPKWIKWADAPDKFEAGTPAIINIIAFAKALRLINHLGNDIFRDPIGEKLSASDILYHDELEGYSGRKLLDELRQTLIGRNLPVPTTEGTRSFINLDNGASTPTFMPIWKTVCQTWRQPGQVQQEIISEVKSICAGVLGAPLAVYDMIFTSNTTEAINLAAESLSREPERVTDKAINQVNKDLKGESQQETEPVILSTVLEHTSNDLPWRMIPGFSLIRMNVDDEGFVDLDELETILSEYNQKCQYGKKRIRLMAVSGASNVLGTFNNLEEISRIVHRYGAHLLVDAAQLVAHRKVNMEVWGIDYLAFSAHKVYAPFGTGVLVVRKGLINPNPNELELMQTSGEENSGGIAALGKAFVLLQRIGMDLIHEEEQALTGRVLRGLNNIAGLTIYGIKNPESARFAHKGGVIVFNLKNMMANVVARALAERGIGVRYGCHCAHLLVKRILNVSPGLAQFQGIMLSLLRHIRLPGLVRVSLGIENTEEDVDTLILALGKITLQSRDRRYGHHSSEHDGALNVFQTHVKTQINDFVLAASERVYA